MPLVPGRLENPKSNKNLHSEHVDKIPYRPCSGPRRTNSEVGATRRIVYLGNKMLEEFMMRRSQDVR